MCAIYSQGQNLALAHRGAGEYRGLDLGGVMEFDALGGRLRGTIVHFRNAGNTEDQSTPEDQRKPQSRKIRAKDSDHKLGNRRETMLGEKRRPFKSRRKPGVVLVCRRPEPSVLNQVHCYPEHVT